MCFHSNEIFETGITIENITRNNSKAYFKVGNHPHLESTTLSKTTDSYSKCKLVDLNFN